jgi:hypothetical protein
VNILGITHAKLVYKPLMAKNERHELFKEDATKKGIALSSCMGHVRKMR